MRSSRAASRPPTSYARPLADLPEKGDGPRVWDVDGNEYLDFHNGFGSMVQGHAHPAIGAALRERYAAGTHFMAPGRTRDRRRRGARSGTRARRWRYTNSGSESTMDAIRIARTRAATP